VALAPVDRALFLRNTCGDDEGLRAEIESLLLDDSRANALLHSNGSVVSQNGPLVGIRSIERQRLPVAIECPHIEHISREFMQSVTAWRRSTHSHLERS
jgi:hypothetical protein